MSFAVFIHRADSIYDDAPDERYQFPPQYLSRVRQAVGDWIIYYEPRKVVGTRGYFAVAKVSDVIVDPLAPGMYRAIIDRSDYIQFPNPVPFNDQHNTPVERGLLNESGVISGRAQSAVRPISAADFNRIISLGLDETQPVYPRIDRQLAAPGFGEAQQEPFTFEVVERPRILTERALRDPAFRRLVLPAYRERCAMTGLRLINGGGRAEVEAAHIRPVEKGGPDALSNGIALSGTAHWMFDRGLLGLSDDAEILVSRHVNDIDGVNHMLLSSRRALFPARLEHRPHPRFLGWHREHVFKA